MVRDRNVVCQIIHIVYTEGHGNYKLLINYFENSKIWQRSGLSRPFTFTKKNSYGRIHGLELKLPSVVRAKLMP